MVSLPHPKRQHVALYVRVSTEEQARENTSVENQVDKLTAYVRDEQLGISCVYVDPGYSGASDQRPAFQLLLSAVRAGQVSRVLVYRQDRFSRSPRHLYNAINELDAAGCAFTSVTEPFVDTTTPMGRQFIHTLAGFAQWELDTFRERSRDGKLKLLEQGRYTGGVPPFGYRVHKPEGIGKGRIAGVLVPDEREAPIVRQMFAWGVEGLSCMVIAERLDALGMQPRKQKWRGRPSSGLWNFGTVYARLTDETYVGRWRYGKHPRNQRGFVAEPVIVNVPALIDEDTFRWAGETLKRNATEATRNARRLYLLRGKIACATCGEPYTGSATRRRSGQLDLYYKNRYQGRQRRPGNCRHPFIPAAFVEDKVWNDLEEFIMDRDALRRVIVGETAQEPTDTTEQRAAAERRLEQLQQAEVRLLLLYADPSTGMAREAFGEAFGQLAKQRSSVEELLADLESRDQRAQTREREILEIEQEMEDFRQHLSAASWQQKRRVVERFVRQVRVSVTPEGKPAAQAVYAFQPAR